MTYGPARHPRADAIAIKNAFRKLARRHHPDISTEPDAEQWFKEIAEAYGVLSDPAKRASYDAHGFAGLAGATPEDLWGSLDLSDILVPAAAGLGGLFDGPFGQAAAGPPRGADLRVDLVIPLRRVLAGGKQTVTISRPRRCPRACPDCGGTGQPTTASRRGPVAVRQVTTCPAFRGRGQVIDQPCRACDGTGQAVQVDNVAIRVPRGVPEGTALRLAGRGMSSPVPGGPPGDGYVIIRTGADPRFTRAGADLWHELHIGVADAVLGSTAAVPALDIEAHVPVPPGTQPGDVLPI